VAQGLAAGDVGADEVALDEVAGPDDSHAGGVGGDDVAQGRGSPTDEVGVRSPDAHAEQAVAERLGAGDVGADEVALDAVQDGHRAGNVHPVGIGGDHV